MNTPNRKRAGKLRVALREKLPAMGHAWVILLVLGLAVLSLRNQWEAAAIVLANSIVLLWIDKRMDGRAARQEHQAEIRDMEERHRRAMEDMRLNTGPGPGEEMLACLKRCREAREFFIELTSDEASETLQYLDAIEAELTTSLACDIKALHQHWASHVGIHHIARREETISIDEIADMCEPKPEDDG